MPRYILFNTFGWVGSYLPILVPKFLATDAFFIFLLVQFIRSLPKELDGAAIIDGCGKWGVFFRIILPLATPALVTTALFINFFVTSPVAGAVLQTNRGVPSSPLVRQAIDVDVGASKIDAEVYRIYDAVADRTIPQGPNIPNDQEFVNELTLIGQQVAFGEITVDEGAEALQALIERLAVK